MQNASQKSWVELVRDEAGQVGQGQSVKSQ